MTRSLLPLIAGLLGTTLTSCQAAPGPSTGASSASADMAPLVATFSVVGFDPATGDLGVVVDEMAKAFESVRQVEGSELADWLVAALEAGQKAGGDKRGQQSAALLVVRDKGGYDRANDRFIDLRVEDHAEPIKELARLLEIHKKFYAGAHKPGSLKR